MSFFSATIQNALKQKKLCFYWLVDFRFDIPAYFHNGRGVLENVGGHDWVGLGHLGKIRGIEEALRHQANSIELTLSGAGLTSQFVTMALQEDRSTFLGKYFGIWVQFCDPITWALLDPPYNLQTGIIDGIPISREEDQDGTTIRTIKVIGENIFYNRRTPSNSYWTDADQKARYPGDRGLEFIPSMIRKEVPVPWTVVPSTWN